MAYRSFILFLFFVFISTCSFSQISDKNEYIRIADEVVSVLASDSLKGRGNYRPELLKASEYIEKHFDSLRLLTLPGNDRFIVPVQFNNHPDAFYSLKINGREFAFDQYRLFSSSFFKPVHDFTKFNYRVLDTIPSGIDLIRILNDSVANVLHISNKQVNIDSIKWPTNHPGKPVLILKGDEKPGVVEFSIKPSSAEVLMNVAAILPGKTKSGEVILISAHYDHVPPNRSRRDSIFNGANDNASGTAALILLAKYFAEKNDNERTLIFCAFAGEELGLLGSKDLVQKLNTDRIIAHLNMDMVGISQYNKKGFLLTGSKHGELYDVISKNLKGSSYKVHGDYDEERNLFFRSDNFPFAQAGVPAHTIMTADDSSKCYHLQCDEVENVDMENIVNTVEAIILSTSTLIDGSMTPKRLRVNN